MNQSQKQIMLLISETNLTKSDLQNAHQLKLLETFQEVNVFSQGNVGE